MIVRTQKVQPTKEVVKTPQEQQEVQSKPKQTRPKSATVSALKKFNLRKPQLRILRSLAGSRRPLSRKEITQQTGLDYTWMGIWIGVHDPDQRSDNDRRYNLRSLFTLGYVRVEQHDDNGKDVLYTSLTPKGRAVVASLVSLDDSLLISKPRKR